MDSTNNINNEYNRTADLPTSESGLPPSNPKLTRFVSLYGFFAINHPEHWKNEIDAAGNFVFFDDQGGSGVIRVITEQRAVLSDNDASEYLQKVFEAQREYDATMLQLGDNKFVQFVQLHELDGKTFSITLFVTAQKDKVIMVTYTVQQMMKDLPVAQKEINQLMDVLTSLEFMHSEEHDHTHE